MDFRAIQVYSLMYLCQQNHIRNNDSKYRLLFIFSLLKRYLSLYIYIYIYNTDMYGYVILVGRGLAQIVY